MRTIGSPESGPESDWLRPQVEQAGLRTYIDVLKARWRIVAGALLVTVVAAAAYLATADKVYKAEADLLVSPVPSEDTLLVSLGLIRQSGEPTRDIETAARVAGSRDVAARARDDLGIDRSPESLLLDITVEPLAQSNLISIEAEAPTPEGAAELANAFAGAVIAERDAAVAARIDEILPDLNRRVGDQGSGVATGESLRSEISRLEFLRAAGDPTTQLEAQARPPTGPSSPRPALTLGAAIFVGLVLGIGGAFGKQALDPRLRREQQLRSNYSLPILARVPRERSRRGRALLPGAVSPATSEAYRTLRANLAGRRGSSGGQLILVTGSAPQEGKTTTAINLAASFALAGNRVILIEADLRRPAIGDTLGVSVRSGIVSTLVENVTMEEALVSTPQFGPNLQLLLAESRGSTMSELFSLRAAQRLLDEARQLADYVIFDSPPLTEVIDALPLARDVDDVLVVSRLGVTRLDRLRELAELLGGNGIVPIGFALIGGQRVRSSYYYERDEEGPTAESEDLPTDDRVTTEDVERPDERELPRRGALRR